ncbi:tRNA dimethylallyltransferase 2 [Apostasia shenzhenica]|uniref:tRNA dimethylallyltransferase 2 n=1 Tax=Apostasia shenzhenica TaxID=1088818 RepID=A0A2I0B3M0_9ASPA|nr:tRNA dimethylallyltransferase 2 [Apostasia shenzhenica]
MMLKGTVDCATFVSENPNPNLECSGEGGSGGAMAAAAAAAAKKKVVVIMGATGVGKSRLAIDLSAHFASIEIINADSMQVYRGLDVLTNKVPFSERNGVPHHLLGTVDPSVEFTAKDFRDLAIPIIDDIVSRGGIPVVVGGTNFYIQSLVSPYLMDDVVEEMEEGSTNYLLVDIDTNSLNSSSAFELLKEIDPIAANRIHPNDDRKIRRYLSVYASSGILPSSLFRGKYVEKWGRADHVRYNCCFIWLDASLPVLDKYVNSRVDCMINSGLLDEVYEIYKPSSDYTKGLKQAIGVRDFGEFFRANFVNSDALDPLCVDSGIANDTNSLPLIDLHLKPNFSEILHSRENELRTLLVEAIDKLKADTRKLVRRQKRRLNHLKTDFGWNLHSIDATKAFSDEDDSWHTCVVEPCVNHIRAFLIESGDCLNTAETPNSLTSQRLVSRDLWTQYICEACGNQVLRGAHEWEQHKQGRVHRKRVFRLKKQSSKPITTDRQPDFSS